MVFFNCWRGGGADVATAEQLFRIIQSVQSPKAEPFKLWLAQVGRERIEENIDVAREGGDVAGIARHAVEERAGVPVITSKNALQLNHIAALPAETQEINWASGHILSKIHASYTKMYLQNRWNMVKSIVGLS